MIQEEEDKSASIAARSTSIDVVAREFLSLPNLDVNIEQRAYLVESTLPTVILALEKLLIEVSRTSDNPKPVQHAVDNFERQPDNIPLTFDPVNWLGQYLYRNNPTYANFSDASPYMRNMHEVAQSLRERLRQLQGERIARLKAQKDLHDQEKERRRAIKLQQRIEKQKTIQQLTIALLHKLVAETWSPDGQFSKSQLLAILQEVLSSDGVQANPSLCHDIKHLREYIESTFENSRIILIADPSFLDHLISVTTKWSNRDFNEFVRSFTAAVTSATAEPQQQFKEAFAPLEACSADFTTDNSLRLAVESIIDSFPVTSDSALPLKRAVQRWVQDRPATQSELFSNADEGPASVPQQGLARLLQQLAGQHSLEAVQALMEFLEARLKQAGAAASAAPEAATAPSRQQGNDRADEPGAESQLDAGVAIDTNKEQSVAASIAVEPAVDRGRQLRTLFKQFASGKGLQTEIASRFINKTLLLATHTCPDAARPRIEQLVIPIPMLSIKTHMTSTEAFVEHFINTLVGATDAQFEEVIDALRETALTHKNEIFGIHPERQQAEARAVQEVARRTREADLSFQKLCDHTLASLTELLRTYHVNVNAKVFLLEPDLPGPDDALDAAVGSKELLAARSHHAVLVARTDALDVGVEVSSGAVMQVAETGDSVSLPVAGEQGDVVLTPEDDELALTEKFGTAVIVPVKNKDGDTIGVVQIDILIPSNGSERPSTAPAGVDVFEDQDVAFVEAVAQQLGTGLDLLESRSKTVVIAESSAFFLKEQADAYTTFFVVEEPGSIGNQSQMLNIMRAEPLDVMEVEGISRYLRPPQHRLSLVGEADRQGATLFKAATSKKPVSFDEDGVVKTAIPILDSDGRVVAIMMAAPNGAASSGIEKQDMDEVVKVAAVLGTALNNVRKQGFKKAKKRKRDFAADDLDEDGGLVFAKFMLGTIRESISELDSSAIAELKSYKKPPPTIHKVLKCILYLFGKTPKQVKLWSDTVKVHIIKTGSTQLKRQTLISVVRKYVNVELLRQMVAYDPTSPQKKSRFVRIRKVLKTIPHGDVKKKGSQPAQVVYAWLIITLDLRDKAVEARKRANLTTTAPEAPEEAAQNEEDDAEEAEMEEA